MCTELFCSWEWEECLSSGTAGGILWGSDTHQSSHENNSSKQSYILLMGLYTEQGGVLGRFTSAGAVTEGCANTPADRRGRKVPSSLKEWSSTTKRSCCCPVLRTPEINLALKPCAVNMLQTPLKSCGVHSEQHVGERYSSFTQQLTYARVGSWSRAELCTWVSNPQPASFADCRWYTFLIYWTKPGCNKYLKGRDWLYLTEGSKKKHKHLSYKFIGLWTSIKKES